MMTNPCVDLCLFASLTLRETVLETSDMDQYCRSGMSLIDTGICLASFDFSSTLVAEWDKEALTEQSVDAALHQSLLNTRSVSYNLTSQAFEYHQPQSLVFLFTNET